MVGCEQDVVVLAVGNGIAALSPRPKIAVDLLVESVCVFGAWMAILAGFFIWLLSDTFDTRVHPTIYGTLASFTGMILGSVFRPDSSDARKIDLKENNIAA